ncbi:hypothetical protein HDU78_003524 [Chytriomyces hyalinus]|nr:hypothetical protein HDU78_003524 [Chytriomyces hyalinus]KAJ3245154.1 hypothetical protein HDU77_009581 [Chytriomyces hyalinus]
MSSQKTTQGGPLAAYAENKLAGHPSAYFSSTFALSIPPPTEADMEIPEVPIPLDENGEPLDYEEALKALRLQYPQKASIELHFSPFHVSLKASLGLESIEGSKYDIVRHAFVNPPTTAVGAVMGALLGKTNKSAVSNSASWTRSLMVIVNGIVFLYPLKQCPSSKVPFYVEKVAHGPHRYSPTPPKNPLALDSSMYPHSILQLSSNCSTHLHEEGAHVVSITAGMWMRGDSLGLGEKRISGVTWLFQMENETQAAEWMAVFRRWRDVLEHSLSFM